MAKKNDSFLADELGRNKPPKNGLGYVDGFKFGFGAAVGVLLVWVLLAVIGIGVMFASGRLPVSP